MRRVTLIKCVAAAAWCPLTSRNALALGAAVVPSRRLFRTSTPTTSLLGASSSSSSGLGASSGSGALLLPYTEIAFNAVEMNVENLPVNDTSEFGSRLFSTITHLRDVKKKNAIYLSVNMLFSHYISVASMFGFKFHHAEGDYCSLLLWLPTDRESVVPPFATHHVGVGALLINKQNEVLVVKERNKLAGWKLPGGYVNLGEDLGDAAAREVYEETGIKSTFKSVISFRHSHNIQWGRGDIYAICRLEPQSNEIKIDSEIDDATWMKLDQFQRENKHEMLAKVLENVSNAQGDFKECEMKSLVPGRKSFKFYSHK